LVKNLTGIKAMLQSLIRFPTMLHHNSLNSQPQQILSK
jgi:hypothetical protein